VREKFIAELSCYDDIDASRRCCLISVAEILHPNEGWLACTPGENQMFVLRVEPVQLDRRLLGHIVNIRASAF